MGTVTKTLTLVPSGYTGLTSLTTSSSYPISNAYKGSGDTSTYARLSLSTSTTGYLYLTFDTSEIPSGATITGVSGTVTVRVSSTSRVTSTVCQLYSGTTAKGSNVTFASTSTSNTVTLTPGTWTASELGDLRLRIGGTGSSSSQSKYIYLYGATITVSYTVTAHDITISNSTSATVTASASSAEAGDSVEIYADTLSGITVTDNGTDVTSQFVQVTSATEAFHPTASTISTFTATNASNAYDDATSTSYAQLALAGSATGTAYFDFGSVDIPSGATITGVSMQVTLQFNANSSSSGFTSSVQAYTGDTAKGSATQWVSSGSNVAKATYTLSIGSWTASELADARFCVTATNSARSTSRQIYVYGATLSVTYEASGYSYTITDIQADHAIVVSPSGGQVSELYVKSGSSWVKVSAAYVKSNGSWSQVSVDSAFQSGVNYIRG